MEAVRLWSAEGERMGLGVIAEKWLTKLLVVLVVLCLLGGCKKPEPTLVVFVGGLGWTQLGDIQKAVERECPHVTVISAGNWDAYKTDLKEIVNKTPHRDVVFVAHSFGCGSIAETAGKLPLVDLAVFIDPAWNDFKLPRSVGNYLWFKRSGLGIEREATIIGAGGARTIEGGHNNIPHSPELIAGVVDAIRRVTVRKATVDNRGKQAVAWMGPG